MRANPKRRGGKCVNSSQERKDAGRKPYRAPRAKTHPFVTALRSLLKNKGLTDNALDDNK